MADHLVRALCLTGGVRILACTAAGLAEEICSLQDTSATASIAMARGLAAGALMGALLKENQRLALKFEGNGPLHKLIIEAESDGVVRGCAAHPEAEVEPLNGSWNVAGLIGKAGFLTVTKDLGFGGDPYRGVVQLVSSEIGEDLAYYLTVSEQTPTAVGLGASLDTEGHIAVCGGFLVQALPQADDEVLDAIMANINVLPPLSALIESSGPEGVLQLLFGDVPFTVLESHPLVFRCGCRIDKIERALLTLGIAELKNMQTEGDGAEVTCEFCRKTYRLDGRELDLLILKQTGSLEE